MKKTKKVKPIKGLSIIDDFDKAARNWGWESDQGSGTSAENSQVQYKKEYKRLVAYVKRLNTTIDNLKTYNQVNRNASNRSSGIPTEGPILQTHQKSNLYECRGCGRTYIRYSNKAWLKSYCSSLGENARMYKIPSKGN